MNRIINRKFLFLFIAIVAMASVACAQSGGDVASSDDSQTIEQSASETRQKQFIKESPLPNFNGRSSERENLVERALTWNQEGKTGFISLLSFGKVVGTFPVSGKVSSVNSALTTPDQIKEVAVHRGREASNPVVVVESPQEDGSYGTNGDAVFWFTPNGAYMEWNGEYFLSDVPMFIEDVPTLTYDATADFGGVAPSEAITPAATSTSP